MAMSGSQDSSLAARVSPRTLNRMRHSFSPHFAGQAVRSLRAGAGLSTTRAVAGEGPCVLSVPNKVDAIERPTVCLGFADALREGIQVRTTIPTTCETYDELSSLGASFRPSAAAPLTDRRPQSMCGPMYTTRRRSRGLDTGQSKCRRNASERILPCQKQVSCPAPLGSGNMNFSGILSFLGLDSSVNQAD